MLTFVVVAALGAPVGFALAQEDSSDAVDPEGTGLPLPASEIAARAEANEADGADPAPGLAPGREPKDINVIADAQPPVQLLQRCEKDPTAEDLCDIALAVDQEKLAPGQYSDEQLEEALQNAGFSGDF